MPIEVIYLENVGIFIDLMSESVGVGQIIRGKRGGSGSSGELEGEK